MRGKYSRLKRIAAVGLVIGTLGVATVKIVVGQIEESRRTRAKAMLEELDKALEAYRAERAGHPEIAPELDAIEHAAWTVMASVLLNLDETLTRE